VKLRAFGWTLTIAPNERFEPGPEIADDAVRKLPRTSGPVFRPEDRPTGKCLSCGSCDSEHVWLTDLSKGVRFGICHNGLYQHLT
jgi:hypothetical protein